jgi:hypothetical protein
MPGNVLPNTKSAAPQCLHYSKVLTVGKMYLQCADETPHCHRNSEKLSNNTQQTDKFFFISNERVKKSLAKILYTKLH